MCISLAMLKHDSTALAAGRPARGCGRLTAALSWPGAPAPLTLSHPPLLPCTPQVALVACKQPSGLPETATCISLAMLKHDSTAMWQLATLHVAVAG